jgi:hypothetical protein
MLLNAELKERKKNLNCNRTKTAQQEYGHTRDMQNETEAGTRTATLTPKQRVS